jgi:DNA-binding CsgD family transcriptional regulator
VTDAATDPPLEPVFVHIDPPPPRPKRGKRGDAVLRAIEASYTPIDDLHEWLDSIFGELDGLGLGSWGTVPTSDGPPVVGSRMIVPAAGLYTEVNERATTARDIMKGVNIQACIPSSRVVDVTAHWMALLEKHQVPLSVVRPVIGYDPPAATALLCTSTDGQEGVVAMLDSNRPIPARIRHQLEAFAAHVEHAYRLRSRLQLRSSDDAQAVLSPDGKVLHATTDAASEARSLTEAVKQSERARGHLRRLDPEEAVATWNALVEGQWSVAEQVESDGKRLLLAFENAPVTPALKLSPQELRVVSYAALGHQQKYIAYELGLTPSSVSHYLSSALSKLRLKNRQELINVFGPRAGRSEPEAG